MHCYRPGQDSSLLGRCPSAWVLHRFPAQKKCSLLPVKRKHRKTLVPLIRLERQESRLPVSLSLAHESVNYYRCYDLRYFESHLVIGAKLESVGSRLLRDPVPPVASVVLPMWSLNPVVCHLLRRKYRPEQAYHYRRPDCQPHLNYLLAGSGLALVVCRFPNLRRLRHRHPCHRRNNRGY